MANKLRMPCENIESKKNSENKGEMSESVINPEEVLYNSEGVKARLKSRFPARSIESEFRKLYEAALMRQAAVLEFEKVRSSVWSKLKNEKEENNGTAFWPANSRNMNIQQLLLKTRPESCTKVRGNGKKKLGKSALRTYREHTKDSNKDSRSISTLKDKLAI